LRRRAELGTTCMPMNRMRPTISSATKPLSAVG
jgi:hypothetical protein